MRSAGCWPNSPAQVGELAGEIVPGVAALAELDLAFAKAKYADADRGKRADPESMAKSPRSKAGQS